MTQELAHLNTESTHQGQLAQTRTETGVSAIEAEVQVIQQAAKVVPTLIDGGMVPDAYSPTFSPRKGAPAQGRDVAIAKAMSAAVYGATIGFGVSKSLQNVFTVHGMPAVYARTMVAQVQSYGHRVWTVESGPSRVTVSAQRRGSEHVETSPRGLSNVQRRRASLTMPSTNRSQRKCCGLRRQQPCAVELSPMYSRAFLTRWRIWNSNRSR